MALPLVGCASDEGPANDDGPAITVDDGQVPFDPTVDSGVDTNIDKSENLNFDEDE